MFVGPHPDVTLSPHSGQCFLYLHTTICLFLELCAPFLKKHKTDNGATAGGGKHSNIQREGGQEEEADMVTSKTKDNEKKMQTQ